ncbi:hypothetical protein [Cohnella nanjingensis]|uniref:Transmembrane protein n=1 Tax=Cohnella nanjingensis TaxID=1387779 RepID=A0A7X0RP99_9BACL|nr:hypothetical protein [Cohnella nanjingensis]MBB6671016.1 hypothetical protein [Cohnella nanjingensis]
MGKDRPDFMGWDLSGGAYWGCLPVVLAMVLVGGARWWCSMVVLDGGACQWCSLVVLDVGAFS